MYIDDGKDWLTPREQEKLRLKKLCCPFCGRMPKIDGEIVTHISDGSCIVDDTQYDLKKWIKRG